MTEVNVIHVSKTMEKFKTLNDVSLHLDKHELVVILGPSGCGKSTLFNIVSGLMLPDQGRIEINGEDWTGRTGRVAYMQQKDLLLPSCNILNNVAIPLILKGMSKKAARQHARSYLSDFGLEGFETYYPRQLSGGMRQRAALLRTYLFASDIMLLDEPFASLDAITRRKMQLWLKNLQQHFNSSILFITHDIEEALLLADRIYVFSARPGTVKMELNLHNSSDQELNTIKNQIIDLLDTF